MSKLDKISQFLPIRFRNGDRIQQFAKKCPHCGKTVSAAHMYGIAANINERVLLAAQAQCAHCQYRFPVTCVITAQKRVLRVALPLWLYRLYIQLLARSGQQPAPVADNPPAAMPEPAPVTAKVVPLEQVTTAIESLGSYLGKPIFAWIRRNDFFYDFERVSPNPATERLADDECLLDAGLVYKRRAAH
jgi:hypothetical protein